MKVGDKVWFAHPNDYWKTQMGRGNALVTALSVDAHGTKWVEMTWPNGALHYAPIEELKVMFAATAAPAQKEKMPK